MAVKRIIVIVALIQFVTASPIPELKAHEDAGLNTVELITKRGYPVEIHQVVTEDGYILNMQRIPYGVTNTAKENRPAVLVMHGLLSSAADWVNMVPEKGLGYLLAEAGYDVWLGNARGSTWSRNHTTLDPNEKEFWQFSWHEIGIYDLPAKIDYILEATGENQVFYIGHSQGTTSSYVMTSQRPEYNDKIRLLVSLAPVAYMSNLLSPFFKVISQFHTDVEWLIEGLGFYEFLPHNASSSIPAFCEDGNPYQELCTTLLFVISGYNYDQFDPATLPVILTNAPAGASYRQFMHYAQGIKSGFFRLYDYGPSTNLEIYGQEDAPDYDLTKITAPVALFYSNNDWCAAVTDVEKLYNELSNPVLKYEVTDPKFNHIDFLWAIDVFPLLYSHVIEFMDEY